jgi:hypothetical protein
VEQREVVGGLLGSADQNAAEAFQPRVCTFNHPAARLDSGMAFGMGLFTAGAQMKGEAERRGQGTRLVIGEAFVKAEMLWSATGLLGSLDRDCLDALTHQPMVVGVGPLDHRPEGNTAAIGKDRALDPALGDYRTVGGRSVFSEGTVIENNVVREGANVAFTYGSGASSTTPFGLMM